MPGAQRLELLCRHIPDRYKHLVRYVGWYSNRARGERAKARKDHDAPTTCAAPVEAVSEYAGHFGPVGARGLGTGPAGASPRVAGECCHSPDISPAA